MSSVPVASSRSALRRRGQAHALLLAARNSTLPFEVSTSGRWVRFEIKGNVVYVVGNVWGSGFSVLTVNGVGEAQTEQFMEPGAAVGAGVRHLGR